MPTDSELLRQHVEAGSEAAFTALVQRYAGLVYATSWRLVGGRSHLARDVTQDVFILLARKAPMLIGHETLAGWLHATTRYISLRTIRNLRRRQDREQEAIVMQINSAPDIEWERLRPLLDEAVEQLDDRDRNAVLLRYFQGQSYREVGAALGQSEDSMRMRTDRAVEKLRRHFARSGVVTTAAVLADALSANAAQAAPLGLVAEVAAAVHANGLGLGYRFLRVLYMTTKTKIAMLTAVILIVGSVPFAMSYQNSAQHPPTNASQNGADGSPKIPQASTSSVPAQAAAPRVGPATAKVPIAQVALPDSTTSQALPGPNELVTAAQYAADGAAAPHADLRKDLATAIPELIRLLEADDQPNLFREFTPLDAKLTAMRGMTVGGVNVTSVNVAADHVRWNPNMMAKDIEVLHAIQGQALSPAISANSTIATYSLPTPVKDIVTVVFDKKGGFWYLKTTISRTYGPTD